MTSIAETLAPLVSSGQWGEAANSLDLFELDHGHTPGWPFALQLLGHAFSNDLCVARLSCAPRARTSVRHLTHRSPAAKLAFKRVPAAAKGDPEVAAAWAVVRALLDADGDALSAALRTHSFSPDAARAAAAVAGEHRRRTLLLLSRRERRHALCRDFSS